MFRKISAKIIFLVVATIVVMAAGIAAVSWKRLSEASFETQKNAAVNILRLVTLNIQNQYSQLVDFEVAFIIKRRELLKQENATILAHLDALLRMAREGRLPEAEARRQALEWIGGQREPGRDIIVFDADAVSLSQADPAGVGKPLEGFRNIRGGDAFASMLERLANASENYSVISWPTRPGGPPRKQLAYFSAFPAWGWVIACTEPIDELEEIVASKREAILKDVNRTLAEIVLPGSGYLFLFHGGGEMLIHPALPRGHTDDPATTNLISRLRQAADSPGVPISYSWSPPGADAPPRPKIAFVEYFKPLDWYICYTLLEQDLKTAAMDLTREFMQLILAAAGLGIATLLFFLRRFTRPIAELMGLVGGLPEREFVLDPEGRRALERLSRRRADEVGQLAQTFMGLQGKLESHLEELGRLSRERDTYIAALEDAKTELEAKVAERTANLLRTNDLLTLEARQREETARSLRASEEKFRALAESMPGVVYLVRTDAGITTVYLNDFIRQITGYAKEDFLERRIHFLDLVHPDDLPLLRETTARAAATRTAYRMEYRLRRKDGQWRWLEDHGRGVASPEGETAALEGVIHDVTDRVESQFHLVAAKEQAEQASRAKTDFLANMSHEIRTPLNTVLGMADLLTETALSPDQRRYVQNLASSGQQLLELISDILDFSRIESGRVEIECEPFDLIGMLEDVAAIVRPAAEKKDLDIEVLAAPELWPWRYGDVTKIRQILVNLASNAVKFTHSGGVLISASEDPGQADRLLFHVVDTGEGIAKEKQRAVFEKFTQADPSIHTRHGGTGLGLAISERLAQAMGGVITLESEPGMGSMFLLSLSLPPSQAPDSAPADQARDQSERHGSRNLRILVAEDVAANQEVVRLYLQGSPVSLAFAGTGREALRLAEEEPFDVVLMDIEMPEMDGLEATRRIRALERATGRTPARIHAVTAHAFAEVRAACLAAGCDGFLAKPLTKRALLAALGLGNGSGPRAAAHAPSRSAGPPAAPEGEALIERIPAQLEPLMPVFFQSVDQHLTQARAGIEAGDWAGLTRIGHAIKGTAATYGLGGLSALGAAFESAARERDAARTRDCLEQLHLARKRMIIEYAPS
jgi:PAS domain S-box-containing protein